MKVRHIGIPVVNVAESLEFYFKLGFNQIKSISLESGPVISNFSGLENVVVRTFKLVNDTGDMIELLDYMSPKKLEMGSLFVLCREGLAHIAFTVTNLEGLYAFLGVERFLYPPQISSDGKVKVAFCRDPNGVFLELVQEL